VSPYTVVRLTSYGRFWDVRTPKPIKMIDIKLGMGDYIDNVTPHTKIKKSGHIRGIPAYG